MRTIIAPALAAAILAVSFPASAVGCWGFNAAGYCATPTTCQSGNCEGNGWFPCGIQIEAFHHLVCSPATFGYEECRDSTTTQIPASQDSPTGYNCLRFRPCPKTNTSCPENAAKKICGGTPTGTWTYAKLPIEWLGDPCG